MSRFRSIKRLVAEGRIEFGLREAIVLGLIGAAITIVVALFHI